MERTIQSPLQPRNIAPFAIDNGFIYLDGQLAGNLLSICGKDYDALSDSYVYQAIELAKRWKDGQQTYDRIMWLRTWIREDYQHGHNLGFSNIRSTAGIAKRIVQLIDKEYGNDEHWKQTKIDQQIYNAQLFS